MARRRTAADQARTISNVEKAIANPPEKRTATVLRDCGHEELVVYYGDRVPLSGGICRQCVQASMRSTAG